MTPADLLHDKQVYFLENGRDLLVHCFNPEHDDSNPSMRIDKITGIFNCLSCGFKGNLFTHYGEEATGLQVRLGKLKKKIIDKRAESIGMEMPKGAFTYDGNWRNIRPETYIKFQAFEHVDPDFASRIVFPIRDNTDKIVAFIGRHTSDGNPRYKVVPPSAKMPLYPFNVEAIKSSVILVEGIFDCINLHDKGLTNAICCFGTKVVNETKLRLLKISGVHCIDIFFDGDTAGQDAAVKLQELCGEVGLKYRNINIKNKDPGELTQKEVQKLKDKLYG